MRKIKTTLPTLAAALAINISAASASENLAEKTPEELLNHFMNSAINIKCHDQEGIVTQNLTAQNQGDAAQKLDENCQREGSITLELVPGK